MYSALTLSALTQECQSHLKNSLAKVLEHPAAKAVLDGLLLGMQELICANAERKSFGIRGDSTNSHYEDTSPDALWSWELFNPSLLPQGLQRQALAQRASYALTGSKSRALERLLGAIDRAATVERDLPKILEEYERYTKVVRKESQQAQLNIQREQAQRDKERAEREKLEQKEQERQAKE